MASDPSSSQTIERWQAALRLFRFHHALGGHANDGDSLDGALPFSGEAGLVRLFEQLERPLVVLPEDAEVPVPGQSYTLDDYDALRQPIRAFPKYEAPSRTRLFGVSVYVSVTTSEVGISLSGADGDPYAVTERDFEHAQAIERALAAKGLLPT